MSRTAATKPTRHCPKEFKGPSRIGRERVAALAEDAPGGYLYFAFLVARVAGALLVEASGFRAQAAAVVNEWVRESVKIRTRKAA
jgi:hypothetical protein